MPNVFANLAKKTIAEQADFIVLVYSLNVEKAKWLKNSRWPPKQKLL
jgi:hypothetical protein